MYPYGYPSRAARSLGDRRLHSGAATQPAGVDQRCSGSGAENIARRIAMSEAGNNPVKVESLRKRLVLSAASSSPSVSLEESATAENFFRSYLVAFLFWIGITLGCLALLMVQHLTGGNWALVIRRILEAGSRTLPIMAVAVLPLLAGMKWLTVGRGPARPIPSFSPSIVFESRLFHRENDFLFCVLVPARAICSTSGHEMKM